MSDRFPLHQRVLRGFRARGVRDLRDLDARGRLGQPPRPLALGSAIFVLVALLGATTFAAGRSEGAQFVLLVIAAAGVFGIAVAVGWALATSEYRAAQQTDRSRAELLRLHAELDGLQRAAAARLHDARALTAAMGAALHALERSRADPVVTAALAEQIDHLRQLLAPPSGPRLEAVSTTEVLLQVSSFATLHGVTLLHEAGDDCELLANREHVLAILQNLIDNARKYAPGSPVLITCEPAGPYLKIAVQDEGPGITAAEAESLFLPGVRRGDTAQGFGMGLAIARSLAEGMNGALWYEPRGERGARFVLKLPRVLPVSETTSEETP